MSQRDSPRNLALVLDRRGDVPIGVQLAWALRLRIREDLEPGERLPGVRELAQDTGINVNTARAAYQRLEQEGLIESHQGSGTFVASGGPGALSGVGSIAADAARQARAAGVDPREVAAALYVTPHADEAAARADAGRRSSLRAQIGTLESALAELEAAYPTLASARDSRSERGAPRLLSAAELEQVRAGLMRRLASVQAAIDEAASDEETASAPTEPARKRAARARKPRARPQARPSPAGA